jgi:hypothetical protein
MQSVHVYSPRISTNCETGKVHFDVCKARLVGLRFREWRAYGRPNGSDLMQVESKVNLLVHCMG